MKNIFLALTLASALVTANAMASTMSSKDYIDQLNQAKTFSEVVAFVDANPPAPEASLPAEGTFNPEEVMARIVQNELDAKAEADQVDAINRPCCGPFNSDSCAVTAMD